MNLQTLLDDARLAAQRVHDVLSAVTGSPITQTIEQRIPGIAGLVEKLVGVEGFAEIAASAIPEVEAGIVVYEELTALGMHPMDPNDIAKLNADKTREM